MKPSKPLAGEADLDARKGSWRYEGGDAAATASPAPAAEAAPAAKPKAKRAPAKEAPAAEMKPSKPLAGEADLDGRKGNWKYEGEPAKPAKRAKGGAGAVPPKTSLAEFMAAQDDGDEGAAAAGEGVKPEALDGPRGGKADDLKRIKGIGPKLETLCHSLGFYHFDQIAAWTREEVAWVDSNLVGFRGRVTRDKWVEQATLLASGGETEFSKRVDDGDVY